MKMEGKRKLENTFIYDWFVILFLTGCIENHYVFPQHSFFFSASPVHPSCVCLWCPRWSGSPLAEPEGCGPVTLGRWSGGGHRGELGSKGWTWRWWRSAAPSTAGLGWWWWRWWWVWRHCWSQACRSCTSAKKKKKNQKGGRNMWLEGGRGHINTAISQRGGNGRHWIQRIQRNAIGGQVGGGGAGGRGGTEPSSSQHNH